jgi:hypothetical protein
METVQKYRNRLSVVGLTARDGCRKRNAESNPRCSRRGAEALREADVTECKDLKAFAFFAADLRALSALAVPHSRIRSPKSLRELRASRPLLGAGLPTPPKPLTAGLPYPDPFPTGSAARKRGRGDVTKSYRTLRFQECSAARGTGWKPVLPGHRLTRGAVMQDSAISCKVFFRIWKLVFVAHLLTKEPQCKIVQALAMFFTDWRTRVRCKPFPFPRRGSPPPDPFFPPTKPLRRKQQNATGCSMQHWNS